MAQIGTRKLTLEIDGTEYTPSVSNVAVASAAAESDFVTYADAASGGARDYTLNMTLAQDAATGSLWRMIWDEAGSDVPVTVAPYGNATPTATEPHFVGTATIVEPDGTILGGEANVSNTAKQTIEVVWTFTGKPVLTSA